MRLTCKHRWEDNIKTDFSDAAYEYVNSTELAQNMI
jgi:hypothetical protein